MSDPPETKPEIKVQKPVEKGEVIQYEAVRDEKSHPDYSLMKKRKQEFGIDKSLDLIVRSDENVQVGDAVAPIKKIAERLQLEEGRIIENDISGTSQSQTTQTHTQMNSKNKIIETDLNKSFQETNSKNKNIKTDLNMSFQDKPIPDQSTKMPTRPPKKEQSHQKTPNHQAAKPHSDNDYTFQAKKPLSRITKEYDQKRHQRVKKQSIPIELDMPAMPQDENEFVPAYSSIEEQSLPIDDLLKTDSKEPNDSRYSLTGSISPETRLDIYPPQSPKPYETSTYLGIRVVYPGANIWDIHFDLLKDYFQHKGVTISPLADEPKKSGESSGVGKILKFSEQLVNIYNLETQSFENNLNVIHPMTVIVVYNMSQIFGILDDIDYSVIDRIEFDGESLWIPSVQ
ncbi:MAG: hypothetical protein OMM_01802 [Candidatus Magnetoglobus multicellularis str. Araruama]|uniref:Uncharacterized protein n=1 Tax=Candidatus Magnetoglobus multicellularis str. Araruama TaxID=890399 RepID=A0A1V1PC15_9BACT|nr:MAG: hypothetical protein OMM_01802 [Candidatus Magnetoglobus multicellularis str. Araruama]